MKPGQFAELTTEDHTMDQTRASNQNDEGNTDNMCDMSSYGIPWAHMIRCPAQSMMSQALT